MPSEHRSHSFSPDGYRALVRAFLTHGYAVRDFIDAAPDQAHLVLRHDIDISIEAALDIAEIEHALGVSSTYFVLVRSELYNAFSRRSLDTLNRMLTLGHRIGLHLDAHLYTDGGLEAGAARECAALEALLARPVSMISFHRPSQELLAREGKIAGRRHAYEPLFFRTMGYCSDSRGVWQRGHPLDHAATQGGRALQLLTHPIWWQHPPASAADRLRQFLAARFDFLDHELADQCAAHQPNGGRTPPA